MSSPAQTVPLSSRVKALAANQLAIAVLAIIVLADLLVDHHAGFVIDGTFGFGAWFGFLACMALIFGSKALSLILRRPDTYYD